MRPGLGEDRVGRNPLEASELSANFGFRLSTRRGAAEEDQERCEALPVEGDCAIGLEGRFRAQYAKRRDALREYHDGLGGHKLRSDSRPEVQTMCEWTERCGEKKGHSNES